jgi:hypothetical protein
MAKQVASTLTSILNHPIMVNIRDRTESVVESAKTMIDNWSMDLYTRKPGPAVREVKNLDGTVTEEFEGTDLDLATFLTALAERRAVINIPRYKGMRVATQREGERVVSKNNRHGNITGLTANQETFAFSLRIFDMNVVKTEADGSESVGAYRNFSLCDIRGDWHKFWSPIEFTPSAKENSFLVDNKLWTDSKVIFKNFVHPNRWVSFYGQYYLLSKAMILRLEEEAQHLYREMKRMQDEGISYPASGEGAEKEYGESREVGEKKAVYVNAFKVEVDIPEFQGVYKTYKNSQKNLVEITQLRRDLRNLKASLTFAVRSVELAFYKNGLKNLPQDSSIEVDQNDLEEKMPSWITDAKWEKDFKEPRGRVTWKRLVLFQPAPGQRGVAIRYRVMWKKEQVSEDMDI